MLHATTVHLTPRFSEVHRAWTDECVSHQKFVVPGEPEQSILWLRTRDTTDEDIECEVVKMPRDRTENLDPRITQMLHDWIAQGAHR